MDLVSSINNAAMQINRHLVAFMLLFGTIGNLLNVCVLTEQSFKKIPCTIYLYWSSISSLLFLWLGMLTRVLQGYNINWPNQNQPLCKIRLFFLDVIWAMGIWGLVGASIDRFLCSSHSVKYRRLSTNRMAKRFLCICCLILVFIFIEVFHCYEASVPNVPVACYSRNLPCRIYNDWIVLLFIIILPSILLIIFGMLTIRNVRLRIVRPMMNTSTILPTRNNDRNLTQMLLIQVAVVLILNLPFGIDRCYASLTANVSKTAYRTAIEDLLYALIILFVFFTHSISFYLYTLTGSLYRAAFKRRAKRYLNRMHLTH